MDVVVLGWGVTNGCAKLAEANTIAAAVRILFIVKKVLGSETNGLKV
jgi:hypothetical protein